MNHYLIEKTSDAVHAGDQVALQEKNLAKVIKLSGFYCLMGKARGVKIGHEECKVKYAMPNPLQWSFLSKLGEEEKFSLSDSDSNDEVVSREDGYAPRAAVMPAMDSAKPQLNLEGIDLVISNPLIEGKKTRG